jgi:ORF6N domain
MSAHRPEPENIVHVDGSILSVRGVKVLLDTDLATLYGVSVKALTQAVKRNELRFPRDFMFQLTRRQRS